MAKKGDYRISDLYQGGYSSLSPSYGETFVGYHIPASQIGAPIKPDTANAIQQVNMLLNQGVVPVEVGVLSPEVFDQIPKQHFKEIRRMSQLSGGKLSVHAPIIEPSGFTDQGWDESNRELAEKQLIEVVEKSAELDPKGKMPITIHCSGIPGAEHIMTKDGKKEQKLIVVNQETGQLAPIKEEEKFYPGDLKNLNKGRIDNPREDLRALNGTEWKNSLSNIAFYKKEADEVLKDALVPLAPILKDFEKGKIPTELTPEQMQAYNRIQKTDLFLQNAMQSFNGIFNKAVKYTKDPNSRKVLENINKDWLKLNKWFEEKQKGDEKDYQELMLSYPIRKAQLLDKSLREIQQISTPEIYVPIEDFAIKHSAKTFGNVAFKSFDKLKEKAPQICIENMFPGMAFSSGEEMDRLIKESRKNFKKAAIAKGYSESKAEEAANRMIGMTLDVGHLNIAKKQGFKDKDLLKEVEQIAKHVRHIHLTDNFGYSDSHLPPGMGNVPFKEIFQELDKEGRLKDVTKIVEAGGFVQHFGTSPYPISLEAMGSPIYSMEMQPYWNQVQGLSQGYSSGYSGSWLPQVNYETFGSGFSNLPSELGGQKIGAQGSRMSGRGME